METKTVMKVGSKELGRALKAIAPVIKPNPIIPVQEGVYLDGQTLTASNNMLSVSLPFECDIKPLILEYQTLSRAVNNLTGEISISPKPGAVELKAGNSKVSVPESGNPNEWPQIKPEKEHELFVLTRQDVEEISKLVAFTNMTANAISFTAIYFNGAYFAASNGFCAGFYHLDHKPTLEEKFAFHPDLFKCLLAIPSSEYHFENGQIQAFNNGELTAMVNYVLVQENNPNFEPFFNLNLPYQVQVTGYDFNKLLNLLVIGVNQSLNIGKLTFHQNGVISGSTAWNEVNRDAYAEIECLSNDLDSDLNIGLFLKLMDAAIKFLNADTLTFNLSEPSRPYTLFGENKNKMCLLMPAKI